MSPRSQPLFVFCLLLLATSWSSEAVDRYVSTTGSDTAAGTLAAPWKTVQKAANSAVAGDTVWIRGGNYDELVTVNVSGSATSGYITFRSYTGETANITGLSPGTTNWRSIGTNSVYAILKISSRSYLKFHDLVFRDFGTKNSSDAIGIYILGTSHHIEVRNCKVRNIGTTQNLSNGVGNANGIGVFGNTSTAITNIIVDGSEIYNLTTGWSESVTFNGNVNGFEFTNNSVHDCNNIGVDCIGYEGTAPSNDQARNGLVSGNTIYNIDSGSNPVYAGERSAAGIYVDGGTGITITRNLIHHCNFGVELGSEHAGKKTSNSICRENLIWNCHSAGVIIGGYDAALGGCQSCSITHNTLYKNASLGTNYSEIEIQNNCVGNTIRHNIVYADPGRYCVVNWASSGNSGNSIDWNCYWVVNGGTSKWAWQDSYIENLSSWRTRTGFDANSLFSNPNISGVTTAPYLRLQSGSPAINRGDTAFAAASGQTDVDGGLRIEGGRVDIGADEFALPVVELSATDPSAAELGSNPGVVRISRTGGTTASLVVSLTTTGTASNGVDYPALSSSVTIPTGQAFVDLTISPTADTLAEGTETASIALVNNAAYASGASTSAMVSIADRPIDAWKLAAFGANANNPAISGDLVDPDKDGLTNLMEYALNSSPTQPSGQSPLAVAVTGGFLTLTVQKNPLATDITYAAEVSAGTFGWSSGGGYTTILVNNTNTFQVRDNTPATARCRFIRLKVSRN